MSEVRPQPANIEAEEALLGSLLMDRDAIIPVAPKLSAGDFYRHDHGRLYQVIRDLYDRRIPADFVTVSDELQRRGWLVEVGGGARLIELAEAVPTSVHAEYYAGIVRQDAQGRRLIEGATTMLKLAHETHRPVAERLSAIQAVFSEALIGSSDDGYVTMLQAVTEAMELIDNPQKTAVPTGFLELDRGHLRGGLRPGQLVVLAARTGVGKTAMASQIARHAARHKGPVGVFSLEMSPAQLAGRMIGAEARISSARYMTMRLEDRMVDGWPERMHDAAGRLGELPIYIAKPGAVSIAQVIAQARDWYARHQIGLLVVDYLQLVRGARSRQENRTQEVGEISRGLKLLALELNIPVLALAQLNRQAEQNDEPQLAHLRESGSIEQDSDVVLFILTSPDKERPFEPCRAAVTIAKNREGRQGTVELRWHPETTQFHEVAHEVTP